MRRLFLAIILSTICLGSANAQDSPNPAITSVIQQQIEAFIAGDLDLAFTFAAPNIRRIFGTPERFGAMVQLGYPMVWRPGDVRFLELRSQGQAARQTVLIRDLSAPSIFWSTR